MGKRKHKSSGHYCWVCQRRRPNERFSGKGHRQHICRDCNKLGPEELAYRQNVRDLERCLTTEGFIRRKQRANFERFLIHENPRIRAMAEKLARVDSQNRQPFQADSEVDHTSRINDGDSSTFITRGTGEPD